jgi:hypothetical protein
MEVQRRDFPVLWLVRRVREGREGAEGGERNEERFNGLLPRLSAAKRRKNAQVTILTTP